MEDTQRILSRMLVSAINAREVESNRVSKALHDEVGQVLSAVGLQLDVLRLDFQDGAPGLASRIREIQAVLDEAIGRVRSLSYDLNPAVVERVGLQSALERLSARFKSGFPGSFRYLYHATTRLPLEVANAWYKIAELALENATSHARATSIELQVRENAKQSTLEVRDNGAGFSVVEAKMCPGLGLLLMEHYASQAPIDIVVKSMPGKGTIVRTTHRLEPSEET